MRSDKKGRRGLIVPMTIVLFVIYSVNCFLLAPLSDDLLSNVLYADGILPILIDIAIVILESVAVAAAYAVLLIMLYRFGERGVGGVFGVFCAATAYKHAATVINAWINNGSIPREWVRYIADIVYFTALELLIMWIAYISVKRVILRFTAHRNVMLKAAQTVGIEEPYPFKSLYAKDNCLLRSAFICALVTFISELALTLINDIWLIIADGAPGKVATWVAMGVNYLSKAVLAIIVYFVTVATMNFLLAKGENEDGKEES